MRPENHYHFDECCIEHYVDDHMATLMVQAVEQAPVPSEPQEPYRKINWRAP
jgi:hypothetical protein